MDSDKYKSGLGVYRVLRKSLKRKWGFVGFFMIFE
jgi:hypothetical protein